MGMTRTLSTRTLVRLYSSKTCFMAITETTVITQSASVSQTVFPLSTHPSCWYSKLLKQLEELSLDQLDPLTKSQTSLSSTPLSSLSLKLNKPYWFLHQGNCEHFLVFDQIRSGTMLLPPRGRPLTPVQDAPSNRSQGRIPTNAPNHPSPTRPLPRMFSCPRGLVCCRRRAVG